MAILILGLTVTVAALVVVAVAGRRRARHELRIDQWHRGCDALGSAAGSGIDHGRDEPEPDESGVGGHVRVLPNTAPGEAAPEDAVSEGTAPHLARRGDRIAAD